VMCAVLHRSWQLMAVYNRLLGTVGPVRRALQTLAALQCCEVMKTKDLDRRRQLHVGYTIPLRTVLPQHQQLEQSILCA
jgi:hypothetical protein